jgi:hypothetical protein
MKRNGMRKMNERRTYACTHAREESRIVSLHTYIAMRIELFPSSPSPSPSPVLSHEYESSLYGMDRRVGSRSFMKTCLLMSI